jgi:pimeloyl-ACP methyl ester carboxylesterase
VQSSPLRARARARAHARARARARAHARARPHALASPPHRLLRLSPRRRPPRRVRVAPHRRDRQAPRRRRHPRRRDRPDWQCGGWRRATAEHAFILCPTGRVDPGNSTKGDTRYTHIGGPALLAYIDASLVALASRYSDYADTDTPLLAGFSLGSWAALALAVQQPARFPRVALVEGVTDKLDDARARTFVEGGGVRVLFGCGQKGCELAAKATAQRLDARDHLPAHVAFAPVNHTFDPPLEDAIHAELSWLVEGDLRWMTDAESGHGP